MQVDRTMALAPTPIFDFIAGDVLNSINAGRATALTLAALHSGRKYTKDVTGFGGRVYHTDVRIDRYEHGRLLTLVYTDGKRASKVSYRLQPVDPGHTAVVYIQQSLRPDGQPIEPGRLVSWQLRRRMASTLKAIETYLTSEPQSPAAKDA